MRIYTNHSLCARNDAVSDLCFARMVRRAEWPDHGCIVRIEDDGREQITFVIDDINGGIEVELNAETQEWLGWEGFHQPH